MTILFSCAFFAQIQVNFKTFSLVNVTMAEKENLEEMEARLKEALKTTKMENACLEEAALQMWNSQSDQKRQ